MEAKIFGWEINFKGEVASEEQIVGAALALLENRRKNRISDHELTTGLMEHFGLASRVDAAVVVVSGQFARALSSHGCRPWLSSKKMDSGIYSRRGFRRGSSR